MANALQWIIREAKKLRRSDRNRKQWKDYVAQASAIYARKHKGKSPVGKKHKPARRKKQARKKMSSHRAVTREHARKMKVTANVIIGSVASHKAAIRNKLKENLGKKLVLRETATRKTDRRRHGKQVTEIKRELRKYL